MNMTSSELSQLFGSDLLIDAPTSLLVVLSSTDKLLADEIVLLKKIIGSTGFAGYSVRYQYLPNPQLQSASGSNAVEAHVPLVFIFRPKESSISGTESQKMDQTTLLYLPSLVKIGESDTIKREVWTSIKTAMANLKD